MDLLGSADDLRIEQIRLDEVDTDDPQRHRDAAEDVDTFVPGYECDGNDRERGQDRSEYRYQTHRARDGREYESVFDVEDQKADVREDSVDQADKQMAANHGNEAAIDDDADG